jgi:Protein of unknown function (DUF3224)
MTQHHASGPFEVRMTPHEASAAALASPSGAADGLVGGATFGARLLDKQYQGPLQAQGHGLMLSAVTSTTGSAGYVALEFVSGTLQGRRGSFVLQHSGLMARSAPQLAIHVVPDSATGELTGLAGQMAIRVDSEGRHCYDFAYTLPVTPITPSQENA